MTHNANNQVQIGALAFELSPVGDAIQLFPAGQFDAPRGAMAGSGPWKIDDQIAARLLQRAAARVNDLVIDYEHQTLKASENGRPAPAAGWITPESLEWRPGAGLYAKAPKWTAAAASHIENQEYRYLSPVFTYATKTGEVLDLLHVALTNTPAVDGMAEIGRRAAARFEIDQSTPTMESPMALVTLIELFSLPKDAGEEQIVAACKSLLDANTKLQADLDASGEALAAAKAQTPDTAREAMASMQAELAALKADRLADQIDELVTGALTDGRLAPAQEKWARDLGATDIASLRTYIEGAKPIAALKGGQTNGKNLDEGVAALTEAEKEVCRLTGKTEQQFLAAKSA